MNGSDLEKRFISYLQENFTGAPRFIIAVSGGLDSVVLCHLFKQTHYDLAIAHCNFKLRGEESNRDEAYVRELADHYEIPFFVQHFDTIKYAEEGKVSIQVAARELRYNWFDELAKNQWSIVNSEKDSKSDNKKADNSTKVVSHTFIATAHHLDDNIETVLMNFFKGSGISGLHGIAPKAGNIVRPLLFASRQDILTYAQLYNLSWVEDSSNAETKYTRNFFRHELLPSIEKVFPMVKENVANNIQRFSEVEELYQQAIAVHKKKLLVYKGTEIHIPILKLQKTNPLASVLYEIIKNYGFSSQQVSEVIKLLSSESGRYMLSSTHRILRNRAWLIISANQIQEEAIVVIEEGVAKQEYAAGQLLLKTESKAALTITNDPSIALLDVNEIVYPLLLRKWKEGDYFYPLGMRKKKKLARFFIDQKLSKLEKEAVWVLESKKRIVWVIGYRIDDRFKIDASTQSVLRIEKKS